MTAADHRRSSAARDRILETAFRLFYARGLRAVGVDTIIAESGVAKATFYKHFPAKDDLIIAYLDRVDEVWTGQLHAAAAAAGPAPADQLVGLFDALGSACRRDGYRGCGFINAAAESLPGTAAHDRTIAHKQRVREWMEALAREAGAGAARAARPRPVPAPGRRAGQRRARRRSGGRRIGARHRGAAGAGSRSRLTRSGQPLARAAKAARTVAGSRWVPSSAASRMRAWEGRSSPLGTAPAARRSTPPPSP